MKVTPGPDAAAPSRATAHEQNKQPAKGVSHAAVPPLQRQIWSTGKLDGFETKVNWTTGQVPSDYSNTVVGKKMVADPLGPEHLQGGPPKSGAQKNLMRQLPTEPKNSNDEKYIRGHLLNDNVGGPGEDYNLFPITAEANKAHEQYMESTVKTWVNDKKQWVRYEVEVKNVQANFSTQTVNSDFDCTASVIDPANSNKVLQTVSVVIPSRFKPKKSPNIDLKNASPNSNLAKVGTQAGKHTPLLSLAKKNAAEYKLNEKLYEALKEWSALYKGEEVLLFKKIETIGKTLGKMFEDVLEDALKYGNLPQTLDKSQKSNLTRINKKAGELIKNLSGLVTQDFGEELGKLVGSDDDFSLSSFDSGSKLTTRFSDTSLLEDDYSYSGSNWQLEDVSDLSIVNTFTKSQNESSFFSNTSNYPSFTSTNQFDHLFSSFGTSIVNQYSNQFQQQYFNIVQKEEEKKNDKKTDDFMDEEYF